MLSYFFLFSFLFFNDQEVGEVMVEHFAADQVLVILIPVLFTAAIDHLCILGMGMELTRN